MRLVFFGSDDFAATNLSYLLKHNHQVVGCVTQPDSRQGRGMKVVVSPIKVLADQYHIPCLQPDNIKTDPNFLVQLKGFNADVFVVVAYGKLLTTDILEMPNLLSVNVHGSLLPKYRGAAPINWAILNGDKETGVTIQKIVLALDAGDIIAQSTIAIPDDMDAQQLRIIMAEEGAKLLDKTLKSIAAKNYQLTPQDDAKSNYASKLTKEMGKIDWKKSAVEIFNHIRGLKPWPGSYTSYEGKSLKILKAHIVDGHGKPGAVISTDKNGFTVACGSKALHITEVHLEASKPMPAASFLAGHKLVTVTIFK